MIAASAWSGSGSEPPDDVPWPTLAGNAERWARELPERYDGALLDEALAAIRELVPTQERLVLCHQDLHGGNILRAEREPWLVIDSKPIVAEPAYDASRADPRRAADARISSGSASTSCASGSGSTASGCGVWGIVKSLAWDNDDEAELFSAVGSS